MNRPLLASIAASLATFAAAAAASPSFAQVAPYSSFRKLVSSNGRSPIVYDLEARRIVSFREHLYRFPAPGQETRELAYDLYLGLRVAGTSSWMTSVPLLTAGYEVGTGLIRTTQQDRGILVTTTYYSPMALGAHAFFVVAELENIDADVSDVALFSLHNFHTGGGPERTSMERIRWDTTLGAYLESSTAPDGMRGVLIAKPLTPASRHTTTPANPFPLVEQSMLFDDVADSGVTADAVGGFQFDVAGRGTFARGDKASFAFAIALASDGDATAVVRAIESFTAGRSPEDLLELERRDWETWRASGYYPVTQSREEYELALQSLAILRMGQVSEPGDPNGAVVASLPPGKWDICWLRDALFSVDAFSATGHEAEAEAALDFLMRGPFGDYQSYVGRPYGLSVARYYGNGREESDFNANGPNIELDGFGMFLESVAAHVARGSSTWPLEQHRPKINDLVAGVLVGFRDMETSLIAADSSIWETHWDNGARQRWAFTSGRAVRGLGDWADLIQAQAADPRAADFRAAAAEIHAAMSTHLIDPATGAIAASVEQLRSGSGAFADAQAALILRRDRFDPAGATGLATLDFLHDRLFLQSTTRRGYKRNDDGDLYDRREWLVIDLGISNALRAAGRTADADALLGWVTAMATHNYLLIPELLDENDARYTGEVPMVGFGAGAYLLALIARSGTMAPPSPDAGVADAAHADAEAADAADAGSPLDASAAPDAPAEDAHIISMSDAAIPDRDAGTTTSPMPASSCGCSSTATQPFSAVVYALIAAGVLALRRRRV